MAKNVIKTNEEILYKKIKRCKSQKAEKFSQDWMGENATTTETEKLWENNEAREKWKVPEEKNKDKARSNTKTL